MIFAVTAILNAGGEKAIAEFQDAFNEHLAQPYRHVRLAGGLHSGEGRRVGFLILIEADSAADAEAYLHESPVFRAQGYERTEVLEFRPEIGRVG
jgi:uncharacterized protein YciI